MNRGIGMICLVANPGNVRAGELAKLLHTLSSLIVAGDADGAALVAKWLAGEFRRAAA